MKNTLKRGFTLVELLVVVLIIGILSSVALPQYQKAVNKSRVAGYWPVLKNLAEAAQLCKLENGSSCWRLGDLDIEAPTCKPLPGERSCSYQIGPSQGELGEGASVVFEHMSLAVTPKGRFCGEFSNGYCAKYGLTGSGISEYYMGGTTIGSSVYALDSTSR